MKSVLIIGMGRFGRHMAQKLYDLGHDVLAIDKNEEKYNFDSGHSYGFKQLRFAKRRFNPSGFF